MSAAATTAGQLSTLVCDVRVSREASPGYVLSAAGAWKVRYALAHPPTTCKILGLEAQLDAATPESEVRLTGKDGAIVGRLSLGD